jgi:hypothetical protein
MDAMERGHDVVGETQADFGRFLAYRSLETTDADAFDGTGHKNGLCAQRGRAQLRFPLLVVPLQYKPTESDSCVQCCFQRHTALQVLPSLDA